MGAKYASQSISGYNSGAPVDDGSQTAANQVKWSTIKTKLPDPIKTLAEAINTQLVAFTDFSVRQISVSDTTVAGDHMRTVEIAPTATTGVTVSLGDAATMTNNYIVRVKNSSSNEQTIGRATASDTIDGAASNVTILAGEAMIFCTTTGATGYLILARGHTKTGQIPFPATQNASTNPNTLDDYEEGTWTPTFAGSTTAGTQTYSQQTARYTKIGRLVFVECQMIMTAKDAATAGDLHVRTLPFATANVGTANFGSLAVGLSKFDLSAGYTQVGLITVINTTSLQLTEMGDNVGGQGLNAAALLADSSLYVGGCYSE